MSGWSACLLLLLTAGLCLNTVHPGLPVGHQAPTSAAQLPTPIPRLAHLSCMRRERAAFSTWSCTEAWACSSCPRSSASCAAASSLAARTRADSSCRGSRAQWAGGPVAGGRREGGRVHGRREGADSRSELPAAYPARPGHLHAFWRPCCSTHALAASAAGPRINPLVAQLTELLPQGPVLSNVQHCMETRGE